MSALRSVHPERDDVSWVRIGCPWSPISVQLERGKLSRTGNGPVGSPPPAVPRNSLCARMLLPMAPTTLPLAADGSDYATGKNLQRACCAGNRAGIQFSGVGGIAVALPPIFQVQIRFPTLPLLVQVFSRIARVGCRREDRGWEKLLRRVVTFVMFTKILGWPIVDPPANLCRETALRHPTSPTIEGIRPQSRVCLRGPGRQPEDPAGVIVIAVDAARPWVVCLGLVGVVS